MKKFLSVLILVAPLCFCVSSYGRGPAGSGSPHEQRHGGKAYFGMGVSYAFEEFDLDQVDDYDVDPSNSWGLDVGVGYHVYDVLSVGFEFTRFPGFDSSYAVGSGDTPVSVEAEVTVTTFIIEAKVSFSTGSRLRPYVVSGVGFMDRQKEWVVTTYKGSITRDSSSISDTDSCAKLGAGVDLFTSENMSIGLGADYVLGFGNVGEIRYFQLGLGFAYHF